MNTFAMVLQWFIRDRWQDAQPMRLKAKYRAGGRSYRSVR